jgi:hypothetical protein
MPRLMLHGLRLHDYAPYTRGLWSVPTEWIIWRIARKRKSTNLLSYSKLWISFRIIYYLLYMLIMQVSPGSDWKTRSWLYARLQLEDTTLIVCPTPVGYPNSGRTSQLWLTSWLRSMSVPCRMCYHLSCERLCMARLDDCSIFTTGKTDFFDCPKTSKIRPTHWK